MKIKEIVSEIAKREGKKSQVKVGDVREVIGHLADMFQESGSDVIQALITLGVNRKRRKKAPK
jgi:hypothetical protein